MPRRCNAPRRVPGRHPRLPPAMESSLVKPSLKTRVAAALVAAASTLSPALANDATGAVAFGSSAAPLEPEELARRGLAQCPSVIGGVVPVVNVQGIGPGALRLDGPTLAAVFLGNVTRWNDPAIAALNPGLSLPEARITVVHRSDGSGTTFNFANYLSKVSPEWKQKVGEGTSLQWPAGIG